jgi:hypothetical protein
MNDSVNEPPAEANSVNGVLAALERRVQALEAKVAALPDPRQTEERITERVKANLPPPVDPTFAPSFKDIALPIPSVQTVVAGAKTTWALVAMFNELKMLFWTLLDRRYHMAWITRVIAIVLLPTILLSHFLLPFARLDTVVSPIWDKLVDLFVGLILFMVLSFETRRYKEWRGKR